MKLYTSSPEKKSTQTILLYPPKLSFKIDGEIKTFQAKHELQQFTAIKPFLKKLLKGILNTEER
jgi:hypothetical protein